MIEKIKSSNFKSIQFLRFFAAFLVLVTHSTFYVHERYDPNITVFSEGAIGVDIFFIISGFVILLSSISRDGGFESWGGFTIKRLNRIVPMYWIATTIKVLTLIFIPAAVLHATLDPSRIILSYFFLPSITPDGRWEPILGVGWTLVFEMFFYVLFALALFLRKNPVIFSSLIIIVFSVISLFRQPDWPIQTFYFDRILLYFVLGMLSYIAIVKLTSVGMRNIAIILVVASLFFIAKKIIYGEQIIERLSLATYIFVLTFFFIIINCERYFTGVFSRISTLFGDASYSTYLFHPLIAPIVPSLFNKISGAGVHFNSNFVVLFTIVSAFIITLMIHILIERPLTKYLRAFHKK